MTTFIVTVAGRPAPQGSKKTGEHGQMREASPYLPAWRAAVKKAVYERYRGLGVEPAVLPLIRGPVGVSLMFLLPNGRRADSPPDLDKLTRSTWDALSAARVWEDDGRVVRALLDKREAGTDPVGAEIIVWGINVGTEA